MNLRYYLFREVYDASRESVIERTLLARFYQVHDIKIACAALRAHYNGNEVVDFIYVEQQTAIKVYKMRKDF